MQITITQLVVGMGLLTATVTGIYQIADFGVPAKATDMRIVKSAIKGNSKSIVSNRRRIEHADNERQALHTQQQVNDQRFKSIHESIGKIETSQTTIIDLLQKRINQ